MQLRILSRDVSKKKVSKIIQKARERFPQASLSPIPFSISFSPHDSLFTELNRWRVLDLRIQMFSQYYNQVSGRTLNFQRANAKTSQLAAKKINKLIAKTKYLFQYECNTFQDYLAYEGLMLEARSFFGMTLQLFLRVHFTPAKSAFSLYSRERALMLKPPISEQPGDLIPSISR